MGLHFPNYANYFLLELISFLFQINRIIDVLVAVLTCTKNTYIKQKNSRLWGRLSLFGLNENTVFF